MARRRPSKKGITKGLSSFENKIFPVVKFGAPLVAFFEQITAKDRQVLGDSFTQSSTTTQVKILANITLGRLAGITPFHKLSDGTMLPTAPQTINPSGVINKWTKGGAMGLAYSIFGKGLNKMTKNMGLGSVVPETAKIGSLSKSIIIGGGLGGFFDDPPIERAQISQATQNFPALAQSGGSQTSYDSSESSF